jgi:CrcB protein
MLGHIARYRRRPGTRSSPRRWRPVLAVLGGGLVGSLGRATVAHAWPADGGFPVSTLVVNLVGSLLLGLYLGRRQRAVTGPFSLQFWGIGLLGSFTTFSAFSFEVVLLLSRGRQAIAASYVLASLTGGLVLAAFGDRLGAAVR